MSKTRSSVLLTAAPDDDDSDDALVWPPAQMTESDRFERCAYVRPWRPKTDVCWPVWIRSTSANGMVASASFLRAET